MSTYWRDYRVDTLSATGNLFVYSGLGIVKFFPGKTDLITDIIPCDFVSNIMLSSIAAVCHLLYPYFG